MTPFDPAPGLIAPDFEQLSLHLPARCLFAFLSEARIERFAKEKGGTPLGRFVSITKSFPIYELQTPDGPIALMQAPVGAPAAVLIEERPLCLRRRKDPRHRLLRRTHGPSRECLPPRRKSLPRGRDILPLSGGLRLDLLR